MKTKKKLLLHVCCGPCSTHTVNELVKRYEVTMHFFNPNIHPSGEYVKRLDNAKIVSKKFNIPIIEDYYEPEEWLELIRGFEEEPEGGKRCKICFEMRLERTAEYAKENGFDAMTTTLSISPYKDSAILNEIGKRMAKKYSVEWILSDFKEDDGYEKSKMMSKELGLYRQNYCGCFYSRKPAKK